MYFLWRFFTVEHWKKELNVLRLLHVNWMYDKSFKVDSPPQKKKIVLFWIKTNNEILQRQMVVRVIQKIKTYDFTNFYINENNDFKFLKQFDQVDHSIPL